MKHTILILSVLLSGCATLHNGNYAVSDGQDEGAPSASGIVISGEENIDLSSRNFGAIDFTFENKSSDWVRVKSVSLDFGDKVLNEAVKVPVGADLAAWAKAAQQNKQIRDYNTAMVLGAAMAGSAVALSASSPRSAGMAAGSIGLLGATGGLTVMALHEDKYRLEMAKVVPDSHLMSSDFVIPPGLHAKKWIALYTKEPKNIPRVRFVTISYVLENGKTEKATLGFRHQNSDWQPQ